METEYSEIRSRETYLVEVDAHTLELELRGAVVPKKAVS
jgi:hypothetical protein